VTLIEYTRRPFEIRGNWILLDTFEILAATLLLVALAPLMLMAMLCVWLEDGGSPLFAHTRIGEGGRAFSCLKFRSMHLDAEQRLDRHLENNESARLEWAASRKLRTDPRVTWVGGFLRRSSIDELPQLLNVVRGEMSLVGPRPIVRAEIVRYGHYFHDYCSVKPGITGLWQVSGRSEVSYRRRVALDVVYARRRCAGLYFRILLRTIPAVLRSRGAY
jgi:exopolysaccharide production protein ExoY